MSRLTVLVADDEAPARRRLRDLLRPHPTIEVVAECASGTAAARAMRQQAPALAFLDVQMPGCSGLDALQQVPPAERPVVIFTTAYDAFAIAAFEAHALDYLLKPFSDERFEEALSRATEHVRAQRMAGMAERLKTLLGETRTFGPAEESAGAEPYPARLTVRGPHRTHVVPVATIDWIAADRDHVTIHAAGEQFRMRTTLRDLVARLDPATFVRVHRSTIVRTDRIESLEPAFRNEDIAVLADGTRLTVSRTYRAAVRRALGASDRAP